MIVSSADIISSFRKRFGVRGSTDLDLSPGIIPVTSVGDLAEPPYHWKGGFIGNFSQPAGGAGVKSFVGLYFNASVPQGYAIVTRMIGISGGVSDYRFKVLPKQVVFSTYGLALAGTVGASWDSGKELESGAGVLADIVIPIAFLGGAGAAVSAIGTDGFSVPISAALPVQHLPLAFVIRPNWCLLVETITANLPLNISVLADIYLPE